MSQDEIRPIIPIKVNLLVKYRVINNNGCRVPAIELRKVVTDPENLKQIISCAYHKLPYIILPSFSDDIKALAALVDKGIIYYDSESGEYHYTL